MVTMLLALVLADPGPMPVVIDGSLPYGGARGFHTVPYTLPSKTSVVKSATGSVGPKVPKALKGSKGSAPKVSKAGPKATPRARGASAHPIKVSAVKAHHCARTLS